MKLLKNNKLLIFSLVCLLVLAAVFVCLNSLSFSVAEATSLEPIAQNLYFGRNYIAIHYPQFLSAYDALANAIENKASYLDMSSYHINQSNFSFIRKIYNSDHAAHYWAPNSIKYSYNSLTNEVSSLTLDNYLTGFDDALFTQKVQEYLALTEGLETDYEKALVLHDALIKNLDYISTAENAHNCYGAIVENEAVCEGYAESYQYLLQLCGIQSYLVIGYAKDDHSVGHEWNLVRLDGKYYHTDVTWDDINNQSFNVPFHGYFNLTTTLMEETHDITDEFHVLPNCTNDDMLYTGMMQVSSYDNEQLGNAMTRKKNIGITDVFFTGDNDNISTWFTSANLGQMTSYTDFHNVGSISAMIYTSGRNHMIVITGPDNRHATSVSLNKAAIELKEGFSETLIPTISPTYCTDDIVWSSSDDSVATVDENGKITAISSGSGTASCTITLTVGSKSATCTVIVKPICLHENLTQHNAQPSSCSLQGWEKYFVCDDCNKYFDEDGEIDGIPYLPLAPHTGGIATCIQKKICDECGEEYGEVDPNNHEGFSDTYLIENSDSFKHYHICVCGVKDEGVYHTGGVATCILKKVCTVCGIEYGSTDASNHSALSTSYIAQNADGKMHYHVCADCHQKDPGENHVWNFESATEEHDKSCTICGYVAQPILGHIHSGVLHKGTPATCTTDGEKDYYTCSCGKFFADENCEHDIVNLLDWKIIRKSHHYCDEDKAVWSWKNGKPTISLACKNCDIVLVEEVVAKTKSTKKATLFKKGEIVYQASFTVNGVKYTSSQTETIPSQIEDFLSPVATVLSFGGAVNGFMMFGIIIGATLLVLLIIIISAAVASKKKRKRKNRNNKYNY